LWHSVYIGFGFLPNDYGVTYNDTCASDKVKSVDPSIPYCSAAYERVLRTATLELAKAHPFFVLKTLAAKSIRLAQFILLYVNLGWIILALRFPGWRRILPFVGAIAFGALPGLLVVPFKPYVLGMLCFSGLFGIYLIGFGLGKFREEGEL
jgi:hypothetical protein